MSYSERSGNLSKNFQISQIWEGQLSDLNIEEQ